MNLLHQIAASLDTIMATPWFWLMIMGFAYLGRYILLRASRMYAGKLDKNLTTTEINKKKYLTYLARSLFTISLSFIIYFVIIIKFV